MNNEKEIRNFYEEEAEYEKSILITKELIKKVIGINIENFNKKIEFLDKDNKYNEFIDLLIAVLGKKTNKYYYCQSEEDVKYYGLEIGKVYKMSEISIELQSKNSTEKILNLQARALLANILINETRELKELFSLNIQKGDGSLATIDSAIITDKDVEYLEELIKYLELISDKSGRLKILVAERDVYAFESAKEEYNKKGTIEKWLYKTFNKEKSVIENMANKRR